ncbi:MAG: hypothetical protein RLZZ481_819 [Pseudomonadota bacterium]
MGVTSHLVDDFDFSSPSEGLNFRSALVAIHAVACSPAIFPNTAPRITDVAPV